MAIPVIAATAETNLGSQTSFAINLPTHSEGDLLLMMVQEGSERTWTVSTWTSIGRRSVSGAGSSEVFAKIAGASEGATKTITASGATSATAVVCAITGAADFASRPMVWGSDGSPTPANIIAPEITATYDDSLIIIGGFDGGGAGFAGTLSGGYTLIANLQQSTSFDDFVTFSRDAAAAASEVIAAKQVATNGSYAWGAFHLAIAPTAGGGGSAIPAFVHHRKILGVQ